MESLKNQFLLCGGGCSIALRASWESQKIVTGAFVIFCISFAAISRAFKIAHNSASRISLLLPRKTLSDLADVGVHYPPREMWESISLQGRCGSLQRWLGWEC